MNPIIRDFKPKTINLSDKNPNFFTFFFFYGELMDEILLDFTLFSRQSCLVDDDLEHIIR